MATLTPNYGLSMPDANDDYLDFRESYNDNMEIIDNNLGGGGGGGDSVTWTQVQQTGTKIAEIDINGTSQDVYAPQGGGSYIDTNNQLLSDTYTVNYTYIATQDCFVHISVANKQNDSGYVTIDGIYVNGIWSESWNLMEWGVFLKEGQTLYAWQSETTYTSNIDVWGVISGTSGGSGHTIYDKDGNGLPQEDGLQFTGNVIVTDDPVNGKTIVDVKGNKISALAYEQLTELEYGALTPTEKSNGVIYFVSDNSTGAKGLTVIQISQADYNNLTPQEKNNNVPYFVY